MKALPKKMKRRRKKRKVEMDMVTFLPFSSGKEGTGEEDEGEAGGDGP